MTLGMTETLCEWFFFYSECSKRLATLLDTLSADLVMWVWVSILLDQLVVWQLVSKHIIPSESKKKFNNMKAHILCDYQSFKIVQK